ncbi:MAG: mechanosensitive ion channel family protein [Longimicrobiales bacterium]
MIQTTPSSGEVPSAVQDSAADALSTLGQEVSDAGRLLADGHWDAFADLVIQGAVGMAARLTPRVLSALFVVAVFYVAYRLLMGAADRFMRRSRRVGQGMHNVLVRTLRVIGLAFITVLGLSQLGVNVSALLAGLGIAGLAVGFAAKDSLENFISGVSILLDRPFRVGHWVRAGDTYGQVTELTLRSTRIRTLNREEVVIPNVQMVSQPLVNHSAVGRLRVDVPFGVAYKEDLDQTRETVMALVEGDDRLASDPEARVVVTKLNDSSVDLELHLYLDDASQAVPVRYEYTEKVRKALAAADIEIPFPHLQLFVDGADGLKTVPAFASAPSGSGGSRSDGPERADEDDDGGDADDGGGGSADARADQGKGGGSADDRD